MTALYWPDFRLIGFVFGLGKLEWLGYNLVRSHDYRLSRLGTIQQRDRHTYRQTPQQSTCDAICIILFVCLYVCSIYKSKTVATSVSKFSVASGRPVDILGAKIFGYGSLVGGTVKNFMPVGYAATRVRPTWSLGRDDSLFIAHEWLTAGSVAV